MPERLKPERPKRPPSKRVKDAQRLARRGAAAKKKEAAYTELSYKNENVLKKEITGNFATKQYL